MGERPGGVSALLWVLIVMGLLGLLGNSLSAAGSAGSEAMIDLAAQGQSSALAELEGEENEALRGLLEGQQEMMTEMAAVARRTRPVTLAMGVLGMLVSGLLVFAAFRGLKGGGGGDVLLRRALWAAGLWSVASFAVSFWMQRLQASATGDQMERMMELAAEAGGEGAALPNFGGLQEAMLAVTLVFGALVVLAKLMLYGYGLWYAQQPDARAWLQTGVGVTMDDAGLAPGLDG
jgi:hypothetical protein